MKDMTGEVCGYWYVLRFSHLDMRGRAYWTCRCGLCGMIKDIRGDNLRRGTSTKCTYCVNVVVK